MKKFLTIIMMLSMSLVFTTRLEDNTVQANTPNLFDFYCDSPRFMYTYDVLGDLQNLDCSFRILDAGLDIDEVENINIDLIEVDYNGNFIQVIDNFDTKYIRENSLLTGFEVQTTVNDESVWTFVDLSAIAGEISEVVSVVNITTGIPLIEGDDWVYDEENKRVAIVPYRVADAQSVNISITKYASQEYYYTYFNDLSFMDKDKVFYQFVYNEQVLLNGMIVTSPTYSPNKVLTNYSIDFGDFYFEDTSLDFDDMTNYTYLADENYFLLHYEKDPNFTETLYIKFYDVKNGTIEEVISTDDIFTFQGDNTINDHRSFIPISLNGGEIPALTKGFGTIVNDLPSNIDTFNLSEGVYIVTLENASGTLYDYSDYLFVKYDKFFLPYQLNLLYPELDLSVSQRVDFKRPSLNMNEYFTTTEAKDLGVGFNYYESINNAETFLYLSYKALDTLDVGDIVSFTWTFEPVSLPHSIDTSEFEVTLTDRYEIVKDFATDQKLLNLANYWGFGDESGLTFLSLMILLIANVFLAFMLKARAYIIYAIVNGVSMFILSTLGMLPTWLGIGVGIILIMAIIYNLNVTRGDEL